MRAHAVIEVRLVIDVIDLTALRGRAALTFHPASEAFPVLSDGELRELASDIRDHGLHHPVVVHDGLILDGRNRLKACELAGIEPRFEQWDGEGGSALDFIVSENLKRRHLTASQRAMIAAALKPLYAARAKERQREGGRDAGRARPKAVPNLAQPIRAPSARDEAASVVGVSGSYVDLAAQVARTAPELVEPIRAGRMTVQAAARRAIPSVAARRPPSDGALPAMGARARELHRTINDLDKCMAAVTPKEAAQAFGRFRVKYMVGRLRAIGRYLGRIALELEEEK